MPAAAHLRTGWSTIFFALCLCLFAATGFWHQGQSGLYPDDDNLWLYFLSRKIAEPVKGRDLEEAVISFAQTRNAVKHSIARLEMRRDYGLNYALPVIAWNRLQNFVSPPKNTADYPTYLGTTVTLMFAATAGVAWLMLLVVLVFLRDRRFVAAAALGLGVVALLSLMPNEVPSMVLMGVTNPLAALKNLVCFILNPRHGFSVFSFTPRNYLSVLAVALFALRWSGVGARWLYLLLLPMFGVHSSLTLLLLVHLVALDLFRRRAVLRDPIVLLLIATGFGYGLWRETLWPTVAGSVFIQAALAAFFALLAFAIWSKHPLGWIRGLWPRASQWLDLSGKWLFQRSPWGGDLLLIAAFWAASFLPVALISLFMSDLQNIYFWHQLHGRAIGLLQPVFFFGTAMYLVTRFPACRWTMIVAVLALVWSLGFVHQNRSRSPLWDSFAQEAQRLEIALSGHLPDRKDVLVPEGFVFSEALTYYALGQMLTLNVDRRDDLWRTARAP